MRVALCNCIEIGCNGVAGNSVAQHREFVKRIRSALLSRPEWDACGGAGIGHAAAEKAMRSLANKAASAQGVTSHPAQGIL